MKTTIKTTGLLQLPEGFNKHEVNEMFMLSCQGGGNTTEVSLSTWEKVEKSNTILLKFADGLYLLKSRNINVIENIKFRQYTLFSGVPVDSVGISYIITAKQNMTFRHYIEFHKTHIA